MRTANCCVIVSWFTAALDLDTYPLRNLIRPRCAERAKPGRVKPVLIMHIGRFFRVVTSFKSSVITCPFMANVTQSEP